MRSKFCITSTASFQNINKSQTNRSTTKKTFSFAKGTRFEQPKPTCPLYTYGGDFLARKPSATGIGYGSRSDFTKCLTASPSSSKYNIKTFWDQNADKNKGHQFALSRDKVKFNSYISKEQSKVPSATQYNNEKIYKTNAPKYTLRQKTKMIDKSMTIEPQNINPGPGSYINPQIESKSSKIASKFQNISYGQNRSRRFDSSQTLPPGPAKYKDISSSMPKTGNYLLSQNRGGTKAKFDLQQRETIFDKVFKRQLHNPGPGYYAAPSQFGQYDGDVYNQLRKGKRSMNGWNHLSEKKHKK